MILILLFYKKENISSLNADTIQNNSSMKNSTKEHKETFRCTYTATVNKLHTHLKENIIQLIFLDAKFHRFSKLIFDIVFCFLLSYKNITLKNNTQYYTNNMNIRIYIKYQIKNNVHS